MHTGIPNGSPKVIRLLFILHMLSSRRPPLGSCRQRKRLPRHDYKLQPFCTVSHDHIVASQDQVHDVYVQLSFVSKQLPADLLEYSSYG